MDVSAAGLRALVTAGGSGIGRAIALALVNAGARVHVCDVDAEALSRLSETAPEIGASRADVSSAKEVDQLYHDAATSLGGLDVLINNAGIAGPTAPVEELAPSEWDRVIAVNLSAQFYTIRLAVPLMKKAGGGSILNISSTSGKTGLPLRVAYATSKHAVVGLSQTLARELGPHGIRVNAILPGFVNNARSRRAIADKSRALGISEAEYRKDVLRYISLRTMVEEEDIAAAVLFLCSSAGKYISGQAIGVCGNLEYEI